MDQSTTHHQLARILCPTDTSPFSRVAVRCGLIWARQFGAKAFVLFAREGMPPPRYFTPSQMPALVSQAERAEDELRADLQNWVTEIGVTGVPVEVVVGPGPADRAIRRAVEALQPDMVVMGTHGRTGYNWFRMGSTTESVVREIVVPVLVVREGCRRLPIGEGEITRLQLRRILCVTDAPDMSDPNVAFATGLVTSIGAAVTILHVTAWSASQWILDQAALDGSDLLVLGGCRSREVPPAFGPTCIRVIRHAPCPVLILPGLTPLAQA